ncbi:MAG: NosD domain-containing protein [Candidatus Thorarchaeota archaeon]
MKVNTKTMVLMIIGILFVLSLMNLFSFNLAFTVKENNYFNLNHVQLKISAISGRIHINNNWSDSKTAGICTGSGIESDPYIIENLEIDGQGLGSCLLIENSNAHFKIQNCYFNNTGSSYYDAGIKLDYVDNGQLLNNNATGEAFGFFLNNTNNILIVGNRLTAKRGLYIGISSGTIMYLNDLIGQQLDMFIAIRDESAYRFFSPKKAIYTYKGNTFTQYLGNYWSGDVSNSDNNNDGIGDTPQIYYDSYDQLIDQYPLIDQVINYEIVSFTEGSEGMIPGYNPFLLIAIMSIISVFLLKKVKKS